MNSFVRVVFLVVATAAAGARAQPLSLDESVRAGEAQSPRLAAQRHAVEAAGHLVGRAAELPDPKLRLGLENLPLTGAERYRYDRDFMTMRSIGVVQEFPNPAKRAALGERSGRQRDAEQAILAVERVRVRREAALAWLELSYAARARTILEALVARIEAQAEAVAAGVAGGTQATAESYLLRGAAGQARDRVTEQERVLERARIALAQWIGGDAQRTPAAPPDSARPPLPLGELIDRLAHHPRLRLVDSREHLARSEADVARSTKNSDWSLQVGYAQREPAFSNMLSVMVMMDLPWQAEQRQDRDVAARLSEVARVQAEREEARRTAEAEIRGWFADHRAATRRVARFNDELLPLAKARIDAALAAYRGGRGALGEVLEARRAETEVELALNGAEADRARAWASLRYVYPEGEGR